MGRYTNQYLCLCSHAWSVEVSHGKIRVRLRDYEEALCEIGREIDFYNNVRPHMSIGNKKPMDVYSGEAPGKNLWKKD